VAERSYYTILLFLSSFCQVLASKISFSNEFFTARNKILSIRGSCPGFTLLRARSRLTSSNELRSFTRATHLIIYEKICSSRIVKHYGLYDLFSLVSQEKAKQSDEE